MTISEETRHRLYRRLEEVLGPEEAATLMEHLPPVGWADVATKRDLDALEGRMDLRFDALETRFQSIDLHFDALETRFQSIDLRFDALEPRFQAIDLRFDALEPRFQAIDLRFDVLDSRFDAVDSRFDAVDSRFELADAHLDARCSGLEARFERALRAQTWRLLMAMVAMGAMVVAAVRL